MENVNLCEYGRLLKRAGEIKELEGKKYICERSEFCYDIDAALKDNEITQEQRDFLFNFI